MKAIQYMLLIIIQIEKKFAYIKKKIVFNPLLYIFSSFLLTPYNTGISGYFTPLILAPCSLLLTSANESERDGNTLT